MSNLDVAKRIFRKASMYARYPTKEERDNIISNIEHVLNEVYPKSDELYSREKIAVEAMRGLLSNYACGVSNDAEAIAKKAVDRADALIVELQKKK